MTNVNIVPQEDVKRGWRQWHIDQIYTGDDGTGRIVPNVKDLVYDPKVPAFKEVEAVVNRITTLGNPLDLNSTGVTGNDGLIGNGGGHVSETYRLNVDTSGTNVTCSFDVRLRTYDSAATHVKLFLGVDTSVNGTVISAMYNNSGQYVSENIPFGSAYPDVSGQNIKSPLTGYLTRPLGKGERITAVIYADGVPRSECKLITRETTNIRPFNGVKRIVDAISLRSIWLSPDEENTLIVPVNVPTADIRARCLVTYIDGGSREYEIDGVRAALHGLTSFSSNSPGERKPITLSYYPTDNEEVRGGGSGLVRHKSIPAYLRSREADGAYSVKLFVCPEWRGEANGYALRYYLFNLDGNMAIDVTRYVYSSDGSRFRPHAYGEAQSLAVKLDVGDAVSLGNSYAHLQQFVITLAALPTASPSPWFVDYLSGVTYGTAVTGELTFDNADKASVNLHSGAKSQDEWLNKLYYATTPLFSASDNTLARRPSHIDLIFDGYTERHSIDDWNKDMPLDLRASPYDGSTLLIRFVLVTPTQDIYLSQSSVNMRT